MSNPEPNDGCPHLWIRHLDGSRDETCGKCGESRPVLRWAGGPPAPSRPSWWKRHRHAIARVLRTGGLSLIFERADRA